jgi:hypothetical protein
LKKQLSIGFCRKCNKETEGQSRGVQHFCLICKTYSIKINKNETFVDNGYTAQYVVSSEKRINSINELMAVCTFDKNIWKIDRYEQEIGTSEGYRKDRKVSWHVSEDGRVRNSNVEDTGKMLVVPLHSFKIRIWLSRKTEEIRNKLIVNEFTVKAVKFSPKYKTIKYKKQVAGHLFELAIPDMQLGRLVASEDAGFDITPESQIKKADDVVNRLINNAAGYNISRVLFPVGNDFFDTNTASMSTAHGTPQEDDVRWKRTYKLGCDFIVRTTEKLQQIAPVDLLIIPGNHDEDKIWHLGEYISAWFHNNKNVFIDNRPQKRKYYIFDKNLIGLTHGYYEKNNKLDSLMAYEVKQLWADSINREWHIGHKHHKTDMTLDTNELENGVVIRILRCLADPSIWEFDKGLVGSLKAGEAFIWDALDGVVGQFTARGHND